MGQKQKRISPQQEIEYKESIIGKYIYRILRVILLILILGFLIWYLGFSSTKNFVQSTIAGFLITAILGFLIWYLGFNPSSTLILPLIQGKPYKIYNYWIHSIDRWDHFLIDESNEAQRMWERDMIMSGMTHVSFNGNIQMGFEIENTAKFSQLNVVALRIKVSRKPIRDKINVLELHPGLGGGAIRKYKIVTKYDTSPTAPETQFLKAKPVVDSEFDYLKLSPGEREWIELELALPESGMYQITPIAIIRFREVEYKHHFDHHDIVIPNKASLWRYGKLEFEPTPITIELKNSELWLGGMVEQTCYEPILFEVDLKHVDANIFIMQNDYLYSPVHHLGLRYPTFSEPKWGQDGNEIIYHDDIEEEAPQTYSLDLRTGIVKVLEAYTMDQENLPFEVRALLKSWDEEIGQISWSPRKEYIALILPDKTLIRTSRKRAGQLIMIEIKTSKIINIAGGTDSCYDMAWSPSGKKLAFLCASKLVDDRGHLYLGDGTALIIYDIDGNSRSIAYLDGARYPSWSHDEKRILLGGKGIHTVELESQRVESFINSYFSGEFKTPKWKPVRE